MLLHTLLLIHTDYDLGAVNWRQLAFIFMGWVLTLPAAGLVAGLLCVMALNAPHF
jgi:PiT family inorganic phosphate transporter